MTSFRFHTVDVFTDKMFGGNQLAVFPDARGMNDEQMNSITREFNFSETVFVFPPADPKHTRKVRIFTPGRELPFAGHPTVGTAFVLCATGEVPYSGNEQRIVLEEGVGPVAVLVKGKKGRPSFAQFSTAKLPDQQLSPLSAAELARILSLKEISVIDDGRVKPEIVSCGLPFLLIPIRDVPTLAIAKVRMDVFDSIAAGRAIPEFFLFTEDKSHGTIRARMFGPALGIAEDPATGSAAAALAGYLAVRSGSSAGTLRWTIRQGVEMGRPSTLEIEADLIDGKVSAVRVGGDSVLMTAGTMELPD